MNFVNIYPPRRTWSETIKHINSGNKSEDSKASAFIAVGVGVEDGVVSKLRKGFVFERKSWRQERRDLEEDPRTGERSRDLLERVILRIARTI